MVSADCPAGKAVLGSGAYIFPSLLDGNRDTAPIVLHDSVPAVNFPGWFARASEIAAYNFGWDLTVYAICANVTTTTVAAANETAAVVATPVPPVSADGDQTTVPVTVTEPTTTTAGAQTIFLPLVTN